MSERVAMGMESPFQVVLGVHESPSIGLGSQNFRPRAEARPTGRAVSASHVARRLQVIGTNRWRSEPPCVRKGVPH
jgi:hypothetical protein